MPLKPTNEKTESLERLNDLSMIIHIESWQAKVESKSESRTFTLTISSHAPENSRGSDLCVLCFGSFHLLTEILQGCWGTTWTYDRESLGQGFSAVCFFWRDPDGSSWRDASGSWLMSLNPGVYNPVTHYLVSSFPFPQYLKVIQEYWDPRDHFSARGNWGPEMKGLAQSHRVLEVAELGSTSGFFPPTELC